MSLLSPSGKSWISSISSSHPKVAHLWCSYRRTLCLSSDGSCLRFIHHSMSRHLSCIFRFFAITACRNTYAIGNTSNTRWKQRIHLVSCRVVRIVPECYRSTEWTALGHSAQCRCWTSLPTSGSWAPNHSQKCWKQPKQNTKAIKTSPSTPSSSSSSSTS